MAISVSIQPTAINWSRNPVRLLANTNLAFAVGIHLKCTLTFVPDSTLASTQIIEFPLTPTPGLIVQTIDVDLQRLLDGFLNYQTPALDATVVNAKAQTGTFKIKLEEYTDAVTPGESWESGFYKIIKGGYATDRQNRINDFNLHSSLKTGNIAVLSWLPRERTQRSWEYSWISIMNIGTTDVSYAAIYQVYFTDGTSTAVDAIRINLPSGGLLSKHEVFHIPSGYKQIGADTMDTSKEVWYYELRLQKTITSANTAVLATVYMGYGQMYEQLQFNYFNSLSGFDSVVLTGKHEESIDRSFDLTEQQYGIDYTGTADALQQYFVNGIFTQQNFKSNIGYTDMSLLHQVRKELLVSPRVVWPRPERFWPVIVTSKKVGFGMLDAQLRDTEIEWQPAFANENYSPDVVPEAPGITICQLVLLPGYIGEGFGMPDGHVGVAYNYAVTLIGDEPIELGAITKPSWMTVSILGKTIFFTGMPDTGGTDIAVSVETINCGTHSYIIEDVIDVAETSACRKYSVYFPGFAFDYLGTSTTVFYTDCDTGDQLFFNIYKDQTIEQCSLSVPYDIFNAITATDTGDCI